LNQFKYNPKIQSRIFREELENFLVNNPEIEQIFDPTQIFDPADKEVESPAPATDEEWAEWASHYDEVETKTVEQWEIKTVASYEDFLLQCIAIRKERSPDTLEKLNLLHKQHQKDLGKQALLNSFKNFRNFQILKNTIIEQDAKITSHLKAFNQLLDDLENQKINFQEARESISSIDKEECTDE
jgi:hypothetical protein